ncbi:alpha/beta hydrolase [Dyella terrae]|nr:alpha/beta fold hydrolase [Dyella terrae]
MTSFNTLAGALILASQASVAKVETIPLHAANATTVALHCIEPSASGHRGVLFIHGSSFPTMLASGFEFSPGDSWLRFMAGRGYKACGLDFAGFGASDRPAAMLGAADAASPVLRATEAAGEIARAVAFLREHGMTSIHVVAHSWGTIPAATFAAQEPAALASLTLFGPVVPRTATPEGKQEAHPAWFPLTAEERYGQLKFRSVLPAGVSLLDPAMAGRWATAFDAATLHVPGDKPDQLRIPEGPNLDIQEAAAGKYPYDPAHVTAPIFVVYGNYDVIVNDEGARAFIARFTASPLKWQMRIDDGTHVMHLERNRRSLYESVASFIHTVDSARQEGGDEQGAP